MRDGDSARLCRRRGSGHRQPRARGRRRAGVDQRARGGAVRHLRPYLVDFYHVCNYLTAAARPCTPDAPSAWLEHQKEQLNTDRSVAVLGDLLHAMERRAEANGVTGQAPTSALIARVLYRCANADRRDASASTSPERNLPTGPIGTIRANASSLAPARTAISAV